MIKNFKCMNISSKDPEALANFYRSIGAPVFVEDDNYDGWYIGDPEQGGRSACGMKITGISLQKELLLSF